MRFQPIIYEEGQKVGTCFYIKEAEPKRKPTGDWERYAWFKCYCGKEFVGRIYPIRAGIRISCGCASKDTSSNKPRRKIPSYKPSVEYQAYTDMKQRCLNPNNRYWHIYGGRGIKICDRWLQSFDNFLEDVGRRPSNQHSLERIEVNDGYSSTNCKWATTKEQNRNKRCNVRIEYMGEIKILRDWATHFKIHPATVSGRMRKKLPLDQVFSPNRLPAKKKDHV